MKIGFTGAGATGKSTVLELIRRREGCPTILTSIARSVFKSRGLTCEADQDALTAQERWDLQQHIFEEQWALEASHAEFVTERTSLCRLVYTVFRNGTFIGDDKWRELAERVERDLKSYDRLYYFPVLTFAGRDDGFRQVSEAYNWALDAMIQTFLRERKVPFVDVGRTNPEWRAGLVMADIAVMRKAA